MQIKTIRDTKAQLSHLVELACKGEEIIICKAGKPVVMLVCCNEQAVKRKPGMWRGRIKIADGFDDSSPAIEALFFGSS